MITSALTFTNDLPDSQLCQRQAVIKKIKRLLANQKQTFNSVV